MTQAEKLRGEIAEEVRALVGRRKMSGMELARRAGLSQSGISRRLNGVEAFHGNELERIAEVLGVKVGDLLPTPARDIADDLERIAEALGVGIAEVLPGRFRVTQRYGRGTKRLDQPMHRERSQRTRPRGGRPPNRPGGSTPPDGLRRTSLKV